MSWAGTLLASTLVAAPGAVDRSEPAPEPLVGVGIDEHLDAALPLDATFRDERGAEVPLGAYFRRDRPVVLALVYYRCPMLCNLVLNGLSSAVREVGLDPEQDFDVVAISIDPTESPALAAAKKQAYARAVEGAGSRWHFLTGSAESIARVADTVGFRFRYDEERGEYAHQAAVYVATPDGRLSRYLYGVRYEPRDLRLALVEAGQGRVGSSFDRVFLACYHWDALRGTYAPDAVKLMRIGGGLTVLLLGGLLAALWLRDAGAHRTA
jgi:protein SCO1/2